VVWEPFKLEIRADTRGSRCLDPGALAPLLSRPPRERTPAGCPLGWTAGPLAGDTPEVQRVAASMLPGKRSGLPESQPRRALASKRPPSKPPRRQRCQGFSICAAGRTGRRCGLARPSNSPPGLPTEAPWRPRRLGGSKAPGNPDPPSWSTCRKRESAQQTWRKKEPPLPKIGNLFPAAPRERQPASRIGSNPSILQR
jgi:hypothetical protein